MGEVGTREGDVQIDMRNKIPELFLQRRSAKKAFEIACEASAERGVVLVTGQRMSEVLELQLVPQKGS